MDNAIPISLEKVSKLHLYESQRFDDLIPVARFYNNKIVLYNQRKSYARTKTLSDASLENLKDNRVKGQLSLKSLTHLKKHLLPWLTSIQLHNANRVKKYQRKERYIVMLTVTLSSKQIGSDYENRRKLLTPFIEHLKKHHGITHYFYRSESQENGNIHFHIIVDKYLDKIVMQDTWNSFQNRLGYIDEFERKFGHRNAPSVKLTGSGDVKDIVDYVVKYATKEPKFRPIVGRQYGMSDTLLELDVFEALIDNELFRLLNEMLDKKNCKLFKKEYHAIIYFGKRNVYDLLSNLYAMYYKDYHYQVYDYLYNGAMHPDELNKIQYPSVHSFSVRVDEPTRLCPLYVQQHFMF
jgi:hypothetical protein